MFRRLFNRKPLAEHRVSLVKSGREYSFQVKENQTLLDAALMQDVPIPYSCQVGSCGECRCRVQTGETVQIKDLGYMFDDSELSQGYTLACQTYPRSELRLDLAEENQADPAKIVKVEALDEKLLDVRLLVNGLHGVKVGQYLAVVNPAALSRYYSVVSKESRGDQVELELHIALKRDGVMSAWWSSLLELDAYPEVKVGEPKGNYSVRGAGDIIAIAGGSGLGVTAALVSQHLSEFPSATGNIVGVFRAGGSSYFSEIVNKMKQRFGDRVQSVPVCQKEFYTASSLEQLLASQPIRVPVDANGLICGSERLVEHCKGLYAGLGLAQEKVSYDEFV